MAEKPNIDETCPVCNSVIPTSLLEHHVNGHFNGQDIEIGDLHQSKFKTCSICHLDVSEQEWTDHTYSHSLENTKPPSNIEGNGECSSQNSITNSNDEILAHALQHEEQKKMKEKEKREFDKLQSLYGMNSTSGYTKQYNKSIERDISRNKMSIGEYYSRRENMLTSLITGSETMETCTTGIIERLQSLTYTTKIKNNEWYMFCCSTNHYSTGYGDRHWGCGYRNLQMLLSSLINMPQFRRRILKVCEDVPSIPRIQEIIESAWKAGFDTEGARQLDNKLKKTKKWIGATEVATALRFIGLRANIVDFHQPTGTNNTHPQMFKWIKGYFTKSNQTPLYLQHQGHSRTIVGIYEKQLKTTKNQFLLLFDPSHSSKQMQELYKKENISISLLKKSLNQMKSKQYQIVYVDDVTESGMESKVLSSVRIP